MMAVDFLDEPVAILQTMLRGDAFIIALPVPETLVRPWFGTTVSIVGPSGIEECRSPIITKNPRQTIV